MADATLIDGKAVAQRLQRSVAQAAAGLRERHGITPGLAAIVVGDDPASRIYVRNKGQACAAAGLTSFEHPLPGDASETMVLDLIERLNGDQRVDGILVQLPLPRMLDVARVIEAVDPAKDVDGFHPINIGRLWSHRPGLVPCTPQGCMILLRTVHVDLAGAEAVVIGRSQIVGRPLAALLLEADCTVTVVHSKSLDVASICRRADILIAAVGEPALVTGAWVKPGATVVDVGISRLARPGGAALLSGDVDFDEVRRVAGAITPVPGGVGPMTIACLLRNTVIAACRRRGLPDPEQ